MESFFKIPLAWSKDIARGYGRVTHFLPLLLVGQNFHWATVTQHMGRFHNPGPAEKHHTDTQCLHSRYLLVDYFSFVDGYHNALSKSSTFWHSSENHLFLPSTKNKFLKTVFKEILFGWNHPKSMKAMVNCPKYPRFSYYRYGNICVFELFKFDVFAN